MVQKIVDIKNPILRQKAKRVLTVDKKIRDLARDLVDTLKVQKDPEGVGLAAPQIGKGLRMFAMINGSGYRVVINPEIVSVGKRKAIRKKTKGQSLKRKQKREKTIFEGCLSIPNIYGPLKRPQRVSIKFLDSSGKEMEEEFTGFPAQIVLHEIDHLDGKLFIDKLLKEKKPLYKYDEKTDEWEEVEIV